MKVKNLFEVDFPKMFKDQDGFIHFQTKKFHVWSKNVLDETNANKHFKLLKKNMQWD